ncbi:MAG: DUF4333 domain-containing protein [Pseudonocardiales bacterium]|nr:DUF4333 domain-containing protein [Pseudonocardiales bacterium]
MRVLAAAVLAAFVVLGTAGCGAASVPKEQVAQQISDQLNQQIGQRPDSVTCPEDLPATVGATVRCTLKAGTDSLGVVAKVSSVDGSNVKYDIQVDQNVTPTPTP